MSTYVWGFAHAHDVRASDLDDVDGVRVDRCRPSPGRRETSSGDHETDQVELDGDVENSLDVPSWGDTAVPTRIVADCHDRDLVAGENSGRRLRTGGDRATRGPISGR